MADALEFGLPGELDAQFLNMEDGITINEDGSMEFDDPNADQYDAEQFTEHNVNLLDSLSTEKQASIGQDLWQAFSDDEDSRKEWKSTYEKGLKSLKPEDDQQERADKGLSQVQHPLIIEAATQFQARAVGELFPADGPCSTLIMGEVTPEKEDQRKRIDGFMNYQLMEEMDEYFPDMDVMLFHLPLVGQTFKKSYHDAVLGRLTSRFVKAENFVVHYTTVDLQSSERYTHVIDYTEQAYQAQARAGTYKQVGTLQPQTPETTPTDEVAGITPSANPKDGTIRLYEMHVMMELEGLPESEAGIPRPYIITIEDQTKLPVAVRRNWKLGDEKFKKRVWFTPYKFLPGLGFYGYGLYHAIGGLGRAATGSLRSLMDSAAFSNMQGGVKLKGSSGAAGQLEVRPGEYTDIEATTDDIKKAIMPFPFKEPSGTLFSLLGFLVEAGQRFAATTELDVGNASNQAPVGTTLALIEQGSRVFSAIHKRLYYSQKLEFKLLMQLNYEYADEEYPYEVKGASRTIKRSDFDGRVDVIPSADPNTFSNSQRIAQGQSILMLAEQAPDLHDRREAYARMYKAMRVPDYESILPEPTAAVRLDAMAENIALLHGKPITAFEEQDHVAHINVLDQWFSSLPPQGQQMMMNQYVAHRSEHMSMYYRAQIQAQMAKGLPELPDLNDPKAQFKELDAQTEEQITQATAVIINNQPPNMGPPIPDPNGQGGDGQAAAIEAIGKAEAEAIQAKAQAEIQTKQAKAQADMQIQQVKADGDMKVQMAKAQMDMQIKQSNTQMDMQIEQIREKAKQDQQALESRFKFIFDKQKRKDEIELLWVKAEADIQIAREKAAAQIELERQKMGMKVDLEMTQEFRSQIKEDRAERRSEMHEDHRLEREERRKDVQAAPTEGGE